ncbi:MAG: enoyl-CoA hydratase-related protein [Roseovarius sp.]|nr:enoyl-CoA hydratase-related protein [Roseovarius sp.]
MLGIAQANMTGTDLILIEEILSPGVLGLRLNRQDAQNALSTELRIALADVFRIASENDQVRVMVLLGSRKAFASGADLKALAKLTTFEVHKLGYHRLWKAIADFPKPVIAAVRGLALGGGCELALHADMIVAGRSALLGFPKIKLGIMPGAGGTQRLVRGIGKPRAMRLLMTGELLTGEQAAEWGIVSHVVDDEDVKDLTISIATRLSNSPATALEFIKEAVIEGAGLPLSAALALERKSMHLLFSTRDQKEGMQAFLESRKPEFE